MGGREARGERRKRKKGRGGRGEKRGRKGRREGKALLVLVVGPLPGWQVCEEGVCRLQLLLPTLHMDLGQQAPRKPPLELEWWSGTI
jgi:hypothetical protein